MKTFKEFIKLLEELHPELQKIVQGDSSALKGKRQLHVVNKIKELNVRGESTGIEGKTPKGSSRLYMKMDEPHKIIVDSKPHEIRTGIKTAISSPLDRYLAEEHKPHKSLGHMQNEVENANRHVNDHYRVLTKKRDGRPNEYTYNPEGIFPPLIHHDDKTHEWSHVGHSENLTQKKFKDLTKHPDFPKGISHDDFVKTLIRDYDRNNGHFRHSPDDDHLGEIEEHPLVGKFLNYHQNHNSPPHDWVQLGNMGIFKHGDKKHIVGRDHGFSEDVMNAYQKARYNKNKARYNIK